MPVQNAEIAAMFDQAAEFLDIEGENPFRVRAYRRAARDRFAASERGRPAVHGP
jgi:DNA polymerase/3'-5' exonuclease PolX